MGLSPSLLRININGEVGIGKLYLIAVLSTTLCDMVRVNSKLILLA